MKAVIKFLKDCPGAYIYSIALYIAVHYNDRLLMGMFTVFLMWNITSYFHEKIKKEYTDWLEADREHWHKKYMEEKFGKKEATKTTITICKN